MVNIEKIKQVVDALNEIEKQRLIKMGYTNSSFFIDGDINKGMTQEYLFKFVESGKKYYKINKGSSGCFMVEIETGELFNIKAYGVADKNKKLKADIGKIDDFFFSELNLIDVDRVRVLHSKQYNYLNNRSW